MTNKTSGTQIYVTVDGKDYQGWLESSVSKSIEEISGTFSIPVSFDPDDPPPIRRQDEVVIKIGSTPVIKGVVLTADPFYSRTDIGMRIEGRDYTGDLVVGAAIWSGGQWRNAKLEQIARDLCKPYKVQVMVEVDTGKPFARFELEQGESARDAIARAASYRGVMVTRNNDGHLLLTTAGKTKSHAAIVMGKGGNVISMSPSGSDAERGSEYIVQGQGEIDHLGSADAAKLEARAKDPELKRYLPILIQADNSSEAQDLQKQADHASRLRMAQAYRYTYEIEGWEVKGKPWEINTRVPVFDPVLGLNGEEWLIVAVEAGVSRANADVTQVTIAPVVAYEQLPLKEPKPRPESRKPTTKKKHSKTTAAAKKDTAPDWR